MLPLTWREAWRCENTRLVDSIVSQYSLVPGSLHVASLSGFTCAFLLKLRPIRKGTKIGHFLICVRTSNTAREHYYPLIFRPIQSWLLYTPHTGSYSSTTMCQYWDSKILSILLSKLSDCSNTDTLLCYCHYPFLSIYVCVIHIWITSTMQVPMGSCSGYRGKLQSSIEKDLGRWQHWAKLFCDVLIELSVFIRHEDDRRSSLLNNLLSSSSKIFSISVRQHNSKIHIISLATESSFAN